MRALILLGVLFLTGCAGVGTGGFASVIEGLAVDSNPDDGMTESGCFFGEYVGTWTKSRITYTKVIHPEGTEPPDC